MVMKFAHWGLAFKTTKNNPNMCKFCIRGNQRPKIFTKIPNLLKFPSSQGNNKWLPHLKICNTVENGTFFLNIFMSGAQTAVNAFTRKVSGMTLPDVTGDTKIGVVGKISYSVTGYGVYFFSPPHKYP